MNIDVKGVVCGECGRRLPWKIADNIESETQPTEGETQWIKGPFIQVAPACDCRNKLRENPRNIRDNGSPYFDVPVKV